MRKLTILAVALSALLVPAAASAQLTLGARLGYSIAGGDAAKDAAMDETTGIAGAIPIQLEVGYTVIPDLSIGAYFLYGIGRLSGDFSDECDAFDLDCSASVMRLGIQGIYTMSQLSPTFAPWLGVGFGYEWAKTTMEGGGEEATFSFDGFELLNLQAGADFKASPNLGVGPFVSFSFNRFGSGEVEIPGVGSESGDIEDKGLHTYLTIGVRGTFGM